MIKYDYYFLLFKNASEFLSLSLSLSLSFLHGLWSSSFLSPICFFINNFPIDLSGLIIIVDINLLPAIHLLQLFLPACYLN